MPDRSWRSLLHEAVARLAETGNEQAHVEARRIVEAASGWDGAEHALHLDDRATEKGEARSRDQHPAVYEQVDAPETPAAQHVLQGLAGESTLGHHLESPLT
ncbi:MAG: hypothetical protein ACRD0U_10215, partial [Acidimicrobiales bacterium]